MSTDIIVGLLTLLGLMYLAWTQREVRESETTSNEADAVQSITTLLLQAIESLAGRDRLISELREQLMENQQRIDLLEEHDRQKTARINELERKVEQLEVERGNLLAERDALAARLQTADIADIA